MEEGKWKHFEMHFCQDCQFFPKKSTRNGLCFANQFYLPEILTRCYSYKKLEVQDVEKPFWE